MAKIYYNDNGTWKVVDISGGGGGGGSIDADTLNGLLSAGDGISIGKTTAGDKVEVKIDPTASAVFSSIRIKSTTSNSGYKYVPAGIWKIGADGVTKYTYSYPSKSGTFTTENSFKTLFGNQSIVGSGNIDLYRHNICFTSTDQDKLVKIRFIVPSSNNLKVNSLADLKTLLGNTFTYPVNGGTGDNKIVYEITETGYKAGATPYVLYDTVTPYPSGTWTDEVKTV